MADSKSLDVLTPDQLNDLDRAILDYLRTDGRATPRLLQIELQERGYEPGVRQNVNARLTRLAEHEHVENVQETGVYQLVSDPRGADEVDTQAGQTCPWCGQRNITDPEWHVENCPPGSE